MFLLLLQWIAVSGVGGTSAHAADVLRATYYYVAVEHDYPSEPKTIALKTLDGSVLALVGPTYKHALDIEGSGRLDDGRTVNFSGRVDGEVRYRTTASAYGNGVGSCQLVPFHSIAVDPKIVPLGSVVRISETVGMVLPDGSRHDGFWRAEDIGSAILLDRVDLFVGLGDQGVILERAGIFEVESAACRSGCVA